MIEACVDGNEWVAVLIGYRATELGFVRFCTDNMERCIMGKGLYFEL